jgi:hypothetical protein
MNSIHYLLQMVYEQYVLEKYKVTPLLAVGWQGLLGTALCTITLVILNFIPVSPDKPNLYVENTMDALIQMNNSGIILGTFIGVILAFYVHKYLGMELTHAMGAIMRSAVVRAPIEISRTCLLS